MSNVLLNNSILAIYGLWKTSEIVLFTNGSKLITNAVHFILDNFRIVAFLFFGRIPVDLSHFPLYFVSNLSPKYYILKVLMCSFNKRNCIVDKSLKIIKLIKIRNRWFSRFRFGRIPVDSSHFFTHFDSILSPKYFILKVLKELKRTFNPNVWTNRRPTGNLKFRP
jgi:hypothetical protein